MGLSFFIQLWIGQLIGYCIAWYISLRILYSFLRHPVKFIKGTFLKSRPNTPRCLNDPNLGVHEYIHLDDVRLHYVVKGDRSKPLMLLVHGFPEFWYSWRYQIKEFSKDYRVVALDQRGYGDSDKPDGVDSYAIEKLCMDIKQLIRALGYERCVLVSHDWGGAVAWKFVFTWPDMVEKLVVSNCPHPATFQKYLRSHTSQFKKSWYMLFFQVPFLPEFFFQVNDLHFIDRIFASVENNKLSKDDIEAYKYTFSKSGAMTGPINYYRAAFRRPIGYRRSGKVHTPTLVIWGDPDQALDTQLAYLPEEYMANMEVKIIKDSCHFVLVDKPLEFNTAVREFLEKKDEY